ncbi:MAG: FAD-binding oxidoreductase [Thermoanaerobaculia bacterium]
MSSSSPPAGGSPPGRRGAPRAYRLPLFESRQETPSVMTFRFDLEGQRLDYEPGQYVSLALPDSAGPEGQHSFTLSSSPTEEGAIAITTRITGSAFKARLGSLKRGETVNVRGPFGRFTLEAGRPSVMAAGGIGITPFRSMLRFTADTGSAQRIDLLYSSGTVEEIVFRAELESLAGRIESLTVEETVTRPEPAASFWQGRTGRIDAPMLARAAGQLSRPLHYVCGPPGFVSGIRATLREDVGVADEDVRFEEFPGY